MEIPQQTALFQSLPGRRDYSEDAEPPLKKQRLDSPFTILFQTHSRIRQPLLKITMTSPERETRLFTELLAGPKLSVTEGFSEFHLDMDEMLRRSAKKRREAIT